MLVERYQQRLSLQRQDGLFRDPPAIAAREGKYVLSQGRWLLNFASNDYLGLGHSAALRRKVAEHFRRLGSSASSSRLVSANFATISRAEKGYADYFGYEEALFFPSGFQANLGLLGTLFEPGDAILFDKHLHASSVKGLSLSKAEARGYNHSRLDHLEKRLQRARGPAAVITESLFSMDGDCLNSEAFGALKRQYGFFGVVDEAHAFGVLGLGGRGLADGTADVAVGTLGKALGLFGAFVLLPGEIKDYLLNFCASQIYTTSLPEAHAASALDALALMADAEPQRLHLAALSRWMRSELTSRGFRVGGDAHILPLFIGPEQQAEAVAGRLRERGIFVLPARYPTVPLKQALLRVSLTADHDQGDVKRFIQALEESYEEPR